MRRDAVRKPVLYVAAVSAVCVIAVLVWYFSSAQHASRVVDSGSTLLVLCVIASSTAEGPAAACIAVLALGTDEATILFIPDDLWVKTPDGSMAKIGDFAGAGDWALGCTLASSVLGAPIDRYVVLDDSDALSFLALYKAIPVSVTDLVTYVDATDPGEGEIRIEVGERTFGPAEVLAYVRGASPISRVERQRQAFDGLLRVAGEAPRQVSRRDLRGFISGVDTNLNPEDAFGAWTAMEGMPVGAVKSAVLPTREATHGGVARRLLQVIESERIISSLVRGVNVLTAEEISVAVFNGNGIRLSATRAANYLRARGFRVSGIANADAFSYPRSYVVILTQEQKAWMLREALPGPVEIATPDRFEGHYEALRDLVPGGTDVILVVGAGMEFKE